MPAEVDLTNANNALLTFKTWYDIDQEYDYASVQVREKGTAGLVIWYINEKWVDEYGRPDQYTKGHPGEAFATIVDADQSLVVYKYYSGRGGADYSKFQMHDAAFSLNKHSQFFFRGDKQKYISVDNNIIMNPAFDDGKDYSNIEKESLSVKLSNYGLNIFVTDESNDRSTAKIHIVKKGNNQLEVQRIEEEYIKVIVVNGDKITVQAFGTINSMEIVYKLLGDKDEQLNLVNMEKEIRKVFIIRL